MQFHFHLYLMLSFMFTSMSWGCSYFIFYSIWIRILWEMGKTSELIDHHELLLQDSGTRYVSFPSSPITSFLLGFWVNYVPFEVYRNLHYSCYVAYPKKHPLGCQYKTGSLRATGKWVYLETHPHLPLLNKWSHGGSDYSRWIDEDPSCWVRLAPMPWGSRWSSVGFSGHGWFW
jgi:hypothetical protein